MWGGGGLTESGAVVTMAQRVQMQVDREKNASVAAEPTAVQPAPTPVSASAAAAPTAELTHTGASAGFSLAGATTDDSSDDSLPTLPGSDSVVQGLTILEVSPTSSVGGRAVVAIV